MSSCFLTIHRFSQCIRVYLMELNQIDIGKCYLSVPKTKTEAIHCS